MQITAVLVPWNNNETNEAVKYFLEFLRTGTCSDEGAVEKAKAKSQNDGGVLHLRVLEVIKKKVWYSKQGNKLPQIRIEKIIKS